MRSEVISFRKQVANRAHEARCLLETIREKMPVRSSYSRLHDRYLAKTAVLEDVSNAPVRASLVDVIEDLCRMLQAEPPRSRVYDPGYFRTCWHSEIHSLREQLIQQVVAA